MQIGKVACMKNMTVLHAAGVSGVSLGLLVEVARRVVLVFDFALLFALALVFALVLAGVFAFAGALALVGDLALALVLPRPNRPRPARCGAAASSSRHSSSVSVLGSRSFGIFAFRALSVM